MPNEEPSRPPQAIKWQKGGYSPLQRRSDVHQPQAEEFPPATERVPQDADPFQHEYLDEHEVLRVTYQGDDRCQLRCPGCFTGERLFIPLAEVKASGGRKVIPHDEFIGQVEGLGAGLQDFFLIGAEPTMDPPGSAAKLRYVSEDLGIPTMSITNGAVQRERLMETFGEALTDKTFYKLNVSLDSMDKSANNRLRGRSFAFDRTLETIQYLVEINAPVKVQMTVWPYNYHTIMDSVEQLFTMGVRQFAFHSGSIEGTSEPERHGLAPVDPLAWRLLAEELLRFRNQHQEEITHYNVPYLYYTEEELRNWIIGEPEQTDAYLEHLNKIEAGQESVKPVHVCPALSVPQVYVFGNDGPEGQGVVSLCNIHNPSQDVRYADYKPEERRWKVVQDAEQNQMELMLRSPHLCPATPYALHWQSDRVDTEIGPLYAACRYPGSNQVPLEHDLFGHQLYTEAHAYYTLVRKALDIYPAEDGEWPIQRIDRVTRDAVAFRDRIRLLRRDLETESLS